MKLWSGALVERLRIGRARGVDVLLRARWAAVSTWQRLPGTRPPGRAAAAAIATATATATATAIR